MPGAIPNGDLIRLTTKKYRVMDILYFAPIFRIPVVSRLKIFTVLIEYSLTRPQDISSPSDVPIHVPRQPQASGVD